MESFPRLKRISLDIKEGLTDACAYCRTLLLDSMRLLELAASKSFVPKDSLQSNGSYGFFVFELWPLQKHSQDKLLSPRIPSICNIDPSHPSFL